MAKSLAEILAEPMIERPRRSEKFEVYAGKGLELYAEIQRLSAEHDRIIEEAAERPRKMGDGVPPEAQALRDRMRELAHQAEDYKGTIVLANKRTEGEWIQWRIDHPGREKGHGGYREDMAITLGWCDSDALIEDIGTYAESWNGEPLTKAAFDALGIDRLDKKVMARVVIGWYEVRDDDPKASLSDLSALLTRFASSDSPESSESQSDDSSAGSPESSTSTSTTTTGD